MLTLYRIAYAHARKPYRIGLLFTHNNGDFRRDFSNGRIIIFLRGRLENFHMQTSFLYATPARKQFILCLRPPVNTLFFTSLQCISVFTLSANNLSQNFLEESHLLSHILDTRCSVGVAYGFGTKSHPVWCA